MVAIAIDLGTTNTVLSIWKDNGVVIISDIPSKVKFADTIMSNREVANDQMKSVSGVKRLIGKTWSNFSLQNSIKLFPSVISTDEKDNPLIQVMFQNKLTALAPEQIISFMLQKMKALAEECLKEEVTDAVITIPAYFNNNQRQATFDAAQLAGLKVLHLIHEPTAAALAYGWKFQPKGTKKVVVYDLGGGTFDVSVIKINYGRTFDVLAVGGDTHLGGVDFDNILVEHCIKKIRCDNEIYSNKRFLRRLQKACEQAKIKLSQLEETTIDLGCFQDELCLRIERRKFEEMCNQLFKKTLDCVESTLEDARLVPADIDEILLIGGSTQIPKIRDLLQNMFVGKNLNTKINDKAVAHGAAIQAAILSGAIHNTLGQLNDVTPLSLGTEINIDNADIIRRNTEIPSEITKRYQTEADCQTKRKINVYEGGRRYLADNMLLNELTLQISTPANRGQIEVDVNFKLDVNGILFVTATEVGNADTESILIENKSRRLSKDKIRKMMSDCTKYQFNQFNDDSEEACKKLGEKMRAYIDQCFIYLAGTDKIGDKEIKKFTWKCAEETNWLDCNPQAQMSEVRQHFHELQICFEKNSKPMTSTNNLKNIYNSFNAHLK